MHWRLAADEPRASGGDAVRASRRPRVLVRRVQRLALAGNRPGWGYLLCSRGQTELKLTCGVVRRQAAWFGAGAFPSLIFAVCVCVYRRRYKKERKVHEDAGIYNNVIPSSMMLSFLFFIASLIT